VHVLAIQGPGKTALDVTRLTRVRCRDGKAQPNGFSFICLKFSNSLCVSKLRKLSDSSLRVPTDSYSHYRMRAHLSQARQAPSSLAHSRPLGLRLVSAHAASRGCMQYSFLNILCPMLGKQRLLPRELADSRRPGPAPRSQFPTDTRFGPTCRGSLRSPPGRVCRAVKTGWTG
jgi:hypothetical protein